MLDSLSFEALRDLVFRHGLNSNSFLTLYENYRHLTSARTSEPAALPFFETKRAWVGAAEPLAAEGDDLILLDEFADAARAAGKVAMFLPVGEKLKCQAVQRGYGALKVGSEPLFDLEKYRPSLDKVSTAKRLYGRGARVSEFSPKQLSRDRKADLDAMVAEWIGSRKISELGFLNRVQPWNLSEDKRYFWVTLGGSLIAFLAAVPTPKLKSWYLVDVFRHLDSPAGATELLILESMRLLKESGALRVSMGVAPLSGLDDANEESERAHPKMTQLLRFLFNRGGFFYNFKSLHQFKLKFHPTRIEPAYLLFSPPRLGPSNALGITETFVGNPLSALSSSLRHQLVRFHMTRRRRASHSLVPRSEPKDERQKVARCPLTIAMLCTAAAVYLATSGGTAGSGKALAFSWDGLTKGNLLPLFVTPFLHRSLWHLAVTTAAFLLFAGRLEVIAGTSFVALAFILPALAAPLLTVPLLYPALYFYPDAWSHFTALSYVGPSIGLFGCLGALSTFFERGFVLFFAVITLTLVYAAIGGTLMPMTHLTACVLGYGATRWLANRQRLIQ